MTTATVQRGVRKRNAYKDREVGELARDVDDELRRLQARFEVLADQLADLIANPPESYTDEDAQDAVGGILADTATIALDYSDGTPDITAEIVDGSVTNAKLADMATARIKARVTAGTGVPEDATGAQVTALLSNAVGDAGSGGTKGLVPAPAAGDAAAGKFLKADLTWAVPSPSSVSVWMPDAPPASPHACDDEFTTASLAAKWGLYDFASLQTVTTSASRCLLKLAGSGNGTDRLAGIYQAAPASEYVIYTKLGGVNDSSQRSDPCIMLLQDATSSTGDVKVLASTLYPGTPSGAYAGIYSAYNTFVTSTNIPQLTPVRYLRVRVSATTWWADVSTNGIEWVQGFTGAIGFTPAHIGIGFDCAASNNIVLFDFFRMQSGAGTSAVDATYIGRQVSVGV